MSASFRDLLAFFYVSRRGWLDQKDTPMPTYLTAAQVCDRLQVCRETMDRMVRAGLLPAPIKLGPGRNSPIRFETEALNAALAEMRTGK
jgi:predicted DNA-binding transcriptional regulator AlpA